MRSLLQPHVHCTGVGNRALPWWEKREPRQPCPCPCPGHLPSAASFGTAAPTCLPGALLTRKAGQGPPLPRTRCTLSPYWKAQPLPSHALFLSPGGPPVPLARPTPLPPCLYPSLAPVTHPGPGAVFLLCACNDSPYRVRHPHRPPQHSQVPAGWLPLSGPSLAQAATLGCSCARGADRWRGKS